MNKKEKNDTKLITTHTAGFTKKLKYGKLSESSSSNPYAQSHADKNEVLPFNSARKTDLGYNANDNTQDMDYLENDKK